ncbi:biopolymer transporter ExbD [Candidatus Fermentibacterales bacterium]|nr:biopolymer transporter ExbD [Candidatus Fermentibacterales bacterium]
MILHRYDKLSAINMTNLVDVTLVLLVIFMLSAPVIQRSADVTPPSTDQGRIIANLDPGNALVVEIDAFGNINVAGNPVLMEDLSGIADAAISSGRGEAYLRADRDVRYEVVAVALGELRRGGYESVGLVQEEREAEQ